MQYTRYVRQINHQEIIPNSMSVHLYTLMLLNTMIHKHQLLADWKHNASLLGKLIG